jgi:hypothetical protein
MRFAGLCWTSSAIFSYMLARYGINGIFRAGKPWRAVVFVLFCIIGLFGGFRSMLLGCALIFAIQFYLEGMHHTKLLPAIVFTGLLALVICVPMANQLPLTFQRTLSFLPLNFDAGVQQNAQASVNWRLDMWRALLPQVPSHLLLGKGYAISQEDYQMMGRDSSFKSDDPAEQGLALAGDYHSGPLSVILPFGIWGVITFVWFLAAGVWMLRRNHLYGDPALQTVNIFLFASFLAKIVSFIIIFGSLSSDIAGFTGFLGLSLCLNGGICHPNRQSVAATANTPERPPGRPQLQPFFQR